MKTQSISMNNYKNNPNFKANVLIKELKLPCTLSHLCPDCLAMLTPHYSSYAVKKRLATKGNIVVTYLRGTLEDLNLILIDKSTELGKKVYSIRQLAQSPRRDALIDGYMTRIMNDKHTVSRSAKKAPVFTCC